MNLVEVWKSYLALKKEWVWGRYCVRVCLHAYSMKSMLFSMNETEELVL